MMRRFFVKQFRNFAERVQNKGENHLHLDDFGAIIMRDNKII